MPNVNIDKLFYNLTTFCVVMYLVMFMETCNAFWASFLYFRSFTVWCYASHSMWTMWCIASHSMHHVLLRQVVCLSVWLSVTLRYHGNISWNSSKIISWLISLLSAIVFVDMTDLLQSKHLVLLSHRPETYCRAIGIMPLACQNLKQINIGCKINYTASCGFFATARLV